VTDSSRGWSPTTVALLQHAGWRPGRDVSGTIIFPSAFPLFPAAARVLAKFGHLRIGRQGPGLELAQSTVQIDPMLGGYSEDEFAEAETLIHSALYPLGEIDGGYAFLAIDQQGRIFIVRDIFRYVDASFDAALDRLLTGRRILPVDEQGHW